RNALLGGRAGERRVVSDARGQPVSIDEVHPEVAGSPLTLTLDANIQQRSEEVLGALGRIFAPKDATAIVMDPRDGSILAMANWPAVNLNQPSGSSPQALEDRAVSFDYEPGSTFKAITVAAALQDNLVTPATGFDVPDKIQVADRTIHDDTEHGDESLTTAQILAQSSNVGAIKIGMLEGPRGFAAWTRRFGFGARGGIELAGAERGPILPLSRYSGSSMGNLPIGQGQLVTPIQMASAYAAIANGGVLRHPPIIAAVDGRRTAEPAGRRIISAATASSLREMLKGVLALGGTASEVSIPGYQLAGKTGTANKVDPATGQYSKTAYVASFMGFAPASDPTLLCAVIVDEPHAGSIFGGTVGAPPRPRRARSARPLRARGHGSDRNALLWRPQPRAAGRRGDGHQRQDDHCLPGACAARGCRPAVRPARHRHVHHRRRRASRRAHHPGGDRPAGRPARDARGRRPRLRDGGLLARARARKGRRPALRGGDLHQHQPRPPRFPRHHGGLLRGQAAPVPLSGTEWGARRGGAAGREREQCRRRLRAGS